MSSIRLSRKHGVNPAILACFACSEDSGIALIGALPGDAEAPRRMRDRGLCHRCHEIVAAGGVLVIETRPHPESARDGWASLAEAESLRTGRMWGLRGEAFARIFDVARPDHGVVFMDTDATALVFDQKRSPP